MAVASGFFSAYTLATLHKLSRRCPSVAVSVRSNVVAYIGCRPVGDPGKLDPALGSASSEL